jgi:hypothetical protein
MMTLNRTELYVVRGALKAYAEANLRASMRRSMYGEHNKEHRKVLRSNAQYALGIAERIAREEGFDAS